MPERDIQQETITRLRAESRKTENELYRARLELDRVKRDERRAREQRTLAPATRADEIAALRSRLAELERRIAGLAARLREIDARLARRAEQRRLLEHLQLNLAAAENRRAALQRELEELQHQQPRDQERIDAIQAEIERLERTIRELRAAVDDLRSAQDRSADEERRKREQRDATRAELERERAAAREVQASLAETLQPTFEDPERVKERVQALEASTRDLTAQVADKHHALGAAIAELYRETAHPRGPLSRLDDRTPFLLLPVRLETIFAPVNEAGAPARTELWVRAYPDEIAVHTHEEELTPAEFAAGELYWTELVVAAHLQTERDTRRGAAWKHLVTLYGGHRAAWIARQTRPSDWSAQVAAGATQTLIAFLLAADADFFTRLRAQISSASVRSALDAALAADDGDALARLAQDQEWFDRINAAARTLISGMPPRPLTKPDAWTRAPRTDVLPDRFVLLLYRAGVESPREIVGLPISDTVWLGPDPLAAETGFIKDDKQVKFGAAFDWMSDFGKAVEAGLGFRVPLDATEARDGFSKVVAIGLSLSTTADEGASLIEGLLENHQYSAKGFSLVPQGTPTNNTERDGSGYSDNDIYDDLQFYSGDEPPAFDAADPDPKRSRTDGRLLADALGISHAALANIRHADRTDALDASAMNTALFPSTLGYWLKTWMSPVIPAETAREARRFFTKYVSGRGPLSAVRVGDQPYGVLLASDFSRWKFWEGEGQIELLPAAAAERRFLRNLLKFLTSMQEIWSNRVAQLAFIGKAGSDASQVLMDILGLHPLSVEFYQRIGFSDEHLRELDQFKTRGRYGGELASLQSSMPPTARLYFEFRGFDTQVSDISAMRAAHVLWQHYVSALDVPNLVENLPPSESRPLTHNYVDWLAKAAGVQQIKDGSAPANAGSALLYLMLRNALLLQLHHGSYDWLKERTNFEPALQQALSETAIVGVRADVTQLSKYELMATPVQAAEPTHVSPTLSVADWIWSGPTAAEVEAAFAQEQRRALELLASASTARLERAFVEHLDCCNYRLDAWQTGLFAHRLASQRSVKARGVYIGAFGWIEDLKPLAKAFVDPQQLPTLLRPDDTGPVLEEDEVITTGGEHRGLQGGFVHAPSLGHAASAALLRNAYLSHATPDQTNPFAINVSSERVRRAQFVLEGMRNGQPIEALLGYQFERGLHDRSSASAASGSPSPLELNQFILAYRQAFPFEAIDLATSGTGTPIETVPANSVVNGLKLSEASLSSANGYGLNAVLTAPELPGAAQGSAILAERNALLDTIDAVKDLLMAENAYQLVRGNFDRVAAVSLAQKDAQVPREIEVVNTPRGTEFTFTNRITLHFDVLDPTQAASNPWATAPMTPRARTEPGMNFWLGTVLGAAEEIVLSAYRTTQGAAGEEIPHDERTVTLADLHIQPVDFIWLLNLAAESSGGATALETRVAWHYRRAAGIDDAQTVRIRFNPPPAPGQKSFAQVFPLARHLRALLTENRALDAADFLPGATAKAGGGSTTGDNPKGIDVIELRDRIGDALSDLSALADQLEGPTATPTMSLTDAENLHTSLRAIADFGVDDAFAPEADLSSTEARTALLERAQRVARLLRGTQPAGVLDRASALVNQATADKSLTQQAQLLTEAGKLLFAETFNVLPRFTCHNEVDLAAAAAARTQLLKHAVTSPPGSTEAQVVEDWLLGLARVRPKVHRWDIVRTLADTLNDVVLDHVPAQVPYRASDSWLAVRFPDRDPLDSTKPFGISRDTLSVAAHGASAFKVATTQCGILIDEWTEEIPTAEEITGITFRFNQPNAAPPQAMLLVVTPEETGSWRWDDVVGAVLDTLERAKRRAVEPSHLESEGMIWNAIAPALVSEFSTLYDADVSLDPLLMLQFTPLNEFYAAQALRS